MTRDQALAEAVAAHRAKELARSADRDLDHPTLAHHTPKLAAVGALYAATSRAYTALAAELPDTTTDTTTEN